MPYRTQSEDTHPEIERMLVVAWRKQTPARKLDLLRSVTQDMQRLQLAVIRQRHPDAGDWELKMRLASRWLEPELMRRVYGWDPDKEGY